jgi:hypothetical protein
MGQDGMTSLSQLALLSNASSHSANSLDPVFVGSGIVLK